MSQQAIEQLTERIQGIPIEEPLYANDCFVSILLICFFVLAIVLADKGNILGNMLQGFFQPRENVNEGVRTSRNYYLRLSMYGVSFISLSLVFTICLTLGNVVRDTSILTVTLLSFGLSIAFYLLKQGLFRMVDWVFLDKSHAQVWHRSYSNWVILSGIFLYLITFVSVFLDLSLSILLILLVVYVVLIEMCLFYKAFHIFCAKKYGGLQLFVYLCTLELIPLLLVGKVLVLYL